MKTILSALAAMCCLITPAAAAEWSYASADHSSVSRTNANGSSESRTVADAEVAAWLAAGNTPDAYVAPPAPVPQTVSAMQAKVALLNAGKLDAANAWVASQNAQVQLIWSTATTFNRNSALMNGAAAALGWSQADLDALFTAAASINP